MNAHTDQYPLELLQGVRDYGEIQHGVKELFVYYKYEKLLGYLTAEYSSAFLIEICIDSLGINHKSDIVLCSWRLLEGYEDILSITERRQRYLQESGFRGTRPRAGAPSFDELSDNEKKMKADALRKNEDSYYREILNSLENDNFENILKKGIKAHIIQNSVPKRIRLPKPSYFCSTWRQLPPPNDWFTGREAILSSIERKFDTGMSLQVLYGLPGIGKTQIAKKYAYTHSSKYTHIYWIDASSLKQVASFYLAILSEWGIKIDSKTELCVCNAFKALMESQISWLIVYDHYSIYNPSEIQQFRYLYLPKASKQGHILITSQSSFCFSEEACVHVQEFYEEEAVRFLQNRINTKNRQMSDQDACMLAQRLHCYPLALECAGAYIRETPRCTCQDYISILNTDVGIMADNIIAHDYVSQYYDETMNQTIELLTLKHVIKASISAAQKSQQDSEIAESILTFLLCCSIVCPNQIDPNDFAQYSYVQYKKLPSTLADNAKYSTHRSDLSLLAKICSNNKKCFDLVKSLTRYSLLEENENGYFTMNAILQEVIRSLVKREELLSFIWSYSFRFFASENLLIKAKRSMNVTLTMKEIHEIRMYSHTHEAKSCVLVQMDEQKEAAYEYCESLAYSIIANISICKNDKNYDDSILGQLIQSFETVYQKVGYIGATRNQYFCIYNIIISMYIEKRSIDKALKYCVDARIMIFHPLCAGFDLICAGNNVDDFEFVDHVVHVGSFGDTAAANYADFNFFYSHLA